MCEMSKGTTWRKSNQAEERVSTNTWGWSMPDSRELARRPVWQRGRK